MRTQLLDGTSPGNVTELLIQIVSAGPTIVAEEDTKVLDLERLLLENLTRNEGVLLTFCQKTIKLKLTSLTARISPFAFFNFCSLRMKYQ
jgi:hypothetical protein